jgi:hypothetical protein
MIVPSAYDRHLIYLNAEGKQTAFKIIAFDISEKGAATPITYPTPPKGARLYSVEADGFRLFDLATGTTTGHGLVQPE